MPRLLFEIGCEELPAAACMEAALQLPELARTCAETWMSSFAPAAAVPEVGA